MKNISWLVLGLGMVAMACVLVGLSGGAAAWQSGDSYSGSGDWTISNPTILADEALSVSGNIAIKSGGTLTMYNAGITESLASDGGYTINVASGGTLLVYNSAITSDDTSLHYKFTVYGTLSINESTVSEMWGDTASWAGGIQIYSAGAKITGSDIASGQTGGISIWNVAATITGNYIYDNGQDGGSTQYTFGIFVSSDGTTSTKIDSNYIYDNYYAQYGYMFYGYGIYSQYQSKTDTITNNQIYDNGFGLGDNYCYGYQLYLQCSNATVTDDQLSNGNYQLYVYGSSPPTFKNLDISAYTLYYYTAYNVYAYDSAIAFDNCMFSMSNGMGPIYGIYSTGPSSNTKAAVTLKNCDFDYTQTGSYDRRFVYSQYTFVDIASTTMTSIGGGSCYGVYDSSSTTFAGSINMTGTTIRISATTGTTLGAYGYCAPLNISKCYINITNTLSTTYGLYGYYYSPLKISGTVLDLYNVLQSSGSVYALRGYYYSNITLSNSTFNLTTLPPSIYYPNSPYYYGIYNYYYSSLCMDDCWMNISIWGSGSYPYYPYLYVIYSYQYSPELITRSTINCLAFSGGGYYPYTYGIYNQYYSPLTMNDCRYNMTRSAVGQYPYYAYYTYMFDPYQYSDLLFWNCTLNMTMNPTGYYNYYTYMFYPQQYCKLNFTDSTIIFSAKCPENYYSYYFYVFYTYYSPITLLNSKLWINNCTGYYMYAIYTNYGGFTMENSTYLITDNKIMYSSYYMMMYGYGQGQLVMNNSKYLIVNDRDWNQYSSKYVYCAYSYDMPNVVTNSTIDWELLSQGPYVAPPSIASIYYYGFYAYAYSTPRDYLFVNNTFRITHGVNASGGWLFMPYYNCMVRFSNNYINYTHSSNGGSIWYGMANSRTPYYIDNCTVEYMTKSTQPMRGGIMFNQMNYIDLYVNDTKIFMRNDGGFYPFNLFYYLAYSKVYFYNSTLEYNIGGGNGQWGPNDASPAGYLQYTDTIKFTDSTYTITTRSEPVLLRSFNYTTGQSGSLIFDNSKMIWNIQSPNTVASFLYFYTASGGAPGLTTLECNNAQLDMTIAGTDSASQMISMAPGAGLRELKISKTSLSLTVSAVSVNPSTIIYMDGQKGNTMSDLSVTVNGPSAAVDPNGITTVTAIQLVKSYSNIQNFTIDCNGQGRVYGVICDVVSMPVITNVTVNNAYAGVWARFYSQVTVVGCEFKDCKLGAAADGSSNITMSGCKITNPAAGANITDGSWLSLIDCQMTNAVRSLSISESTVWSLNSTFDKGTVLFIDANATLIINWLLQLDVTWQNGVPITGAKVTVVDSLGGLALSAYSGEGGIVPWFFVTEYIQTDFVVKTYYSPYTVNASIAGLTGSTSVTTDATKNATVVVTDPFAPEVEIVAPVDGSAQNTTTVVLVGTAADAGSGIDRLSFSYDGTAWSDIGATKAWQFTMEVPEGGWTLQVRLFDIAGNMASAGIALTVDLTVPFITVDSPADQSLGNKIGVDLKGRVEAGSVLTVNHRPVAVAPDGSFSYGVRLVEGKNVFSLFAADRAGNTNSTSWTLYLDITPPPLTVSSPRDGLLTNQGTVQVAGRTEPEAHLTVNGVAVELGPDGSFSVQYNLARGPNPVSVVSEDRAGNRASALLTVLMDNEIILNVSFPGDMLVTNQVTILVQGTTDTDSLLRLNDGLVTVEADGGFSVSFTLEEGTNELVFSAQDRAGNTATLTRRVVVDTQPPVLEIGSPLPGTLWRTKEVNVSGICEPGITLTINGESVPTDSGTFTKTVVLAEGAGIVQIEGRDRAGNIVSRQVQVTVDLTAPPLEIVEPQTGFRTPDLTVVVVGLTEPGATVLVNGVPVDVDTFGKFSTGVTLQKGQNTIVVSAADDAGNSVSQSLTVKNTVAPGAVAPSGWWWPAVGLLLALGIMIPLTMLLVNLTHRERKVKEGSQ